jgi:hypothetical protein
LTGLDAPVPNPVVELTKQRKSYEDCEEEKETTAKAFHGQPASLEEKAGGKSSAQHSRQFVAR